MKFNKSNEEQNYFFDQLDGNKFISVKGHSGTVKTVLDVKKVFILLLLWKLRRSSSLRRDLLESLVKVLNLLEGLRDLKVML